MKITALLLSTVIVLLGSCNRNKDCCGPSPDIPAGKQVMVLCEGNFQWGNADFDVYLPDSQKFYGGLFKSVNGSPLGDVLQSGLETKSGIWLVLNNSGKLVQVDKRNHKYLKEIKGFKSPRHILTFGDTAIVSDLYANGLSLVNLANGSKISSVKVNGWTEQMAVSGGTIAVAAFNGKVYLLNRQFKLTDSVAVRSGCQWIATDKSGQFWAMASDSGKSELYRINPVSAKVELTMKSNSYMHDPVFNSTGDTLFFLGAGIFKMAITDKQLPVVPFFQETGLEYYSLGIDPWHGQVYLGNARDFVSNGEVLILNTSGGLVKRFNCGINPGDFVFYRN